MTTSKEHISALMDNEQALPSSMNSLAKDKELLDTWDRYHLIRDALKDDLPTYIDIDLSSRIAAAIEQEPTILAPKTNQTQSPQRNSVVSKVFHIVGQYGIAASVALAVLVGVQQFRQTSSEGNIIQQNPVLNTVPVGGAATPVSINYNSERMLQSQSPAMTEKEVQAQRERIARYLQDHQLQQRLSTADR